ncbi:MAG: hypothetical protein BMS9Abin05_0766 [Rhodothermia bacterium]|nr:MAG: hypothetical protein BMS9Abin05_0766 [Rhodothermia bacterium]
MGMPRTSLIKTHPNASRIKVGSRRICCTLFLFQLAVFSGVDGFAQSARPVRELLPKLDFAGTNTIYPPDYTTIATVSATKALGLSLILPGLGQRYVNGGDWGGWGTTFAITDASLWIALFGGEWHQDQLVESYTSLAAGSAGADVVGKDRTFFLNLATYKSSDEFLETVLRNRAWDQIDYVNSPSFQWNWTSDTDFVRFRGLREDAESLRRRRGILIASLIANRIVSGIMAAWRASRIKAESLTIQLGPPPQFASLPNTKIKIRF